jgi:transposase
MELKRIAKDTSKHVFTLHGVDAQDRVVLRRELHRDKVEPFFARLPPVDVALEACGGSHHWGRVLTSLGHRIRQVPPQYLKPFVKRGKYDRNDAEAINEAASRSAMRFVPVKSADQQAGTLILKTRDLLVRQRTQLINAVFGLVVAQGTGKVAALLDRVAGDVTLPAEAREIIAILGEQIKDLDMRVTTLEARMKQAHKANPVSQLLEGIPGVGPIGALSLTLTVDPGQFQSGRHFAAWLGLTPRERSTGGKQRMGGISPAGDERLRQQNPCWPLPFRYQNEWFQGPLPLAEFQEDRAAKSGPMPLGRGPG